MREFEIYLTDLTPEAQKRFIEFYGDDGNFDVFPLATFECDDFDDEDEDFEDEDEDLF